MTTYFSAKDLLTPPTERAAFSDRQAYVCAELSKLAYFKFEGGNTLDELLVFAKEVVGDDSRFGALEQKLRSVLTSSPSAAAEAEKVFKAILDEGGFSLVRTFSEKGTQAFICTRKVPMEAGGEKNVAFLAFRGTEPRDFQDIKADIKAALIAEDVDGERVEFHSGYRAALRQIEADIKNTIDSALPDQLFVTGHSLGGALAIVYTRLYATSTNGACYTYGAPPVGAIEIQNGLKTPVYEIVNEIDIVPRLPNPWLISGIKILLKGFRLIAKLVTVVERVLASGKWDEKLEAHIEAMTKYRHPGYVSYLVGSESAVRLRYNVGSFDQFRWWLSMMTKKGFTGFNKMVSDHMIDVYVEKLKEHARKRN